MPSTPKPEDRLIDVDGVMLRLALPDSMPILAVGSESTKAQLRACWLAPTQNRAQELPLSPRILGRPGVGKTTVAFTIAKEFTDNVHIFQCTSDTRPEDLLVMPVIGSGQQINYHASALTTAMLNGGICILDEGNRMSEKSWASLAPLLDSRRYVESIVAGVKIHAHPDFRMCVTMNDDSSTYEIPEYILSRLQPQIRVGFPNADGEQEILRVNLPYADDDLVKMVGEFLGRCHQYDLPVSSRDGVHIIRFAERLIDGIKISPPEAIQQATEQIVGEQHSLFLDPTYEPEQRQAMSYADAEFLLTRFKPRGSSN